MASDKVFAEQCSAGPSKYEAPAIEQSASFERLALGCARTIEEQKEGGCGAPDPDAAES